MKRAGSHQEHLDRLDLAIQVEDVTVSYNEQPVLWDVDLEIPAGTLMAIIGPNKAGKTTLLKTMLGLIKPSAGRVYVFSRPTMTLKNDMAWVPERSAVDWTFPTTVFDVALMGSYNRLRTGGSPKKTDRELTEEALKRTGIYNIRKTPINDISRGQQQLALIARALVQDPRIYIMDEPFFSADSETETVILSILEELKAAGKTIVVAHHDILTTPKYFDAAAFINVRKIASGTAEEVFNEETIKAAYGNKTGFIKIISSDGRNAE